MVSAKPFILTVSALLNANGQDLTKINMEFYRQDVSSVLK